MIVVFVSIDVGEYRDRNGLHFAFNFRFCMQISILRRISCVFYVLITRSGLCRGNQFGQIRDQEKLMLFRAGCRHFSKAGTSKRDFVIFHAELCENRACYGSSLQARLVVLLRFRPKFPYILANSSFREPPRRILRRFYFARNGRHCQSRENEWREATQTQKKPDGNSVGHLADFVSMTVGVLNLIFNSPYNDTFLDV